MKKTNAVRVLDRLKIAYDLVSYEVNPNDLAADSIAQKVGLPPEQVFKTLVAKGDRHGVCLAVIPGNFHLNLKALATLSGDKKVETVPLKDVQPLTGYIRGGVTALACKKDYPVYLHHSAMTFDWITVSAGQRGLLIRLDPKDYQTAAQATVGAIADLEA